MGVHAQQYLNAPETLWSLILFDGGCAEMGKGLIPGFIGNIEQ